MEAFRLHLEKLDYAFNTQKMYISHVSNFLDDFKPKRFTVNSIIKFFEEKYENENTISTKISAVIVYLNFLNNKNKITKELKKYIDDKKEVVVENKENKKEIDNTNLKLKLENAQDLKKNFKLYFLLNINHPSLRLVIILV